MDLNPEAGAPLSASRGWTWARFFIHFREHRKLCWDLAQVGNWAQGLVLLV